MVDVTTTKFFPLYNKMAESFEKLDNILHDWEKVSPKCIVEALNRYEKESLAGRRKIKLFLSLKNGSQKKYSGSRQSSETKPNAKLVLVNCEPYCIISNLTNPINKTFKRLIQDI